jgi:hypothetical protein
MPITKINGLWPTKAGTGWTGRYGNSRILVLPVDKTKSKDPDRAPDYELLLSTIDENLPLTPLPSDEVERERPVYTPQASSAPAPGSGSAPTYKAPPAAKPKPVAAAPDDHPAFNDDIPF